MKTFPKKIFVNWEKSTNNEQWLALETNIESIDEGTGTVAIYELKEVKTLKVTRELQ